MTDASSFAVERRRLLQCGALIGALPALARAAEPAPLQLVGPWEVSGLAPAASGYMFTRLQVAETLMGARDDGTPAPALAERWSSSADGLVWRFVLRPAARFHDDTPVTAEAVVRCLRAAQVAPSLLSGAPIRSIEADGPGTVAIALAAPHGRLPSLLAHSSTLVLAPSSFDAQGRVERIVGSGPYRIAVLSAPQRIETTVFDGYDGPRPAIARVRYLAAGRAETRALMAEAGQADLAFGLDPVSLQRLRRHGKVPIAAVTLPRTAVLKLNAADPALQDLRVRQALSLSIDRAGIARALLRDPELAATQLFPPTLGDWHNAALPPLRHDPPAAAQLLQQAGWRPSPDGLRNAAGQPLRLVLRTFVDRPELPLFATALQEQWRQAGIAVQIAIGNAGDIPLGHRDGSLQLGLAARNYATVPDPGGTLAQDFGPRGGDWGAMGWKSDAVVAALDALTRGDPTAARAATLRGRIAQVLQDELPVIPVVWYRQQVAVSPRVTGVRLDPLERSYHLTEMAWRG